MNVVEIAKAAVTAYNDKNWSKAKDTLAPDAVYDEKAIHAEQCPIGVKLGPSAMSAMSAFPPIATERRT